MLTAKQKKQLKNLTNGAMVKTMLTYKQKKQLKNHWYTFKLRFNRDYSISAQKQKGEAYSLLYTPQQTKIHLSAVGMPIKVLQCCE